MNGNVKFCGLCNNTGEHLDPTVEDPGRMVRCECRRVKIWVDAEYPTSAQKKAMSNAVIFKVPVGDIDESLMLSINKAIKENPDKLIILDSELVDCSTYLEDQCVCDDMGEPKGQCSNCGEKWYKHRLEALPPEERESAFQMQNQLCEKIIRTCQQ